MTINTESEIVRNPEPTPTIGMISWFDLTIPDAEEVRDFYIEVCGWSFEPHDMGDYDDYEMKLSENGETIAGICHRRGINESLPPVWLPYIEVPDLTSSIQACLNKGGKICGNLRRAGTTAYVVIQDPAGAYVAICSNETSEDLA